MGYQHFFASNIFSPDVPDKIKPVTLITISELKKKRKLL